MYQEMQQQQNGTGDVYGGGIVDGFSHHELLQPWSHPFLLPPPPPMPSYGGLMFNRRLIAASSEDPFGLHAELQKLTTQEIMDAKALAASKAHSEAERKRRERINIHLTKLRTLLPSTTKTDKASLLAEVIQHLKELKRQTCLISETSELVPTETNELTVDNASINDGKLLIRASICCEDRPDLLPDLIQTLKSLRLRALKAEITALGGRVKNVLFITAEDDDDDEQQQQHQHRQQQYSINSIQEALKAIMEKSCGDIESGSGSINKRQRTNINQY